MVGTIKQMWVEEKDGFGTKVPRPFLTKGSGMYKEKRHGWRLCIGGVILLVWGAVLCVGEQDTVMEPITGMMEEETRQKREETEQIAIEAALQSNLHEVPSLSYGSATMHGGGDYACYQDMLVLGAEVYRRKQGCFEKTAESVYDLFGLSGEQENICGGVRQYGNLLVLKKDNTFYLYDMNTGETDRYTCGTLWQDSGQAVTGQDWYIYDGMLYYIVSIAGETPVRIICRMGLSDGAEQEFYRPEDGEWEMLDRFMMRADGSLITEFCLAQERWRAEYRRVDKTGRVADRAEADRTISELALYNEDYRFEKWLAYNEQGLFGQNKFHRQGSCGVFCQQDGGVRTDIGMQSEADVIFTEGGYFVCRDGSFCDFQGNRLHTYFAGQDYSEESFTLKTVIYEAGMFTAFYENVQTGRVSVRQEKLRETDRETACADLWYWIKDRKADRVSLTFDQEAGNITGYQFQKTETDIAYSKKPDFLTEPEVCGKGIFISERREDVEIFLAGVLLDTLENQGKVSAENQEYFSERAVRQFAEAPCGWLEDWKGDPYRYDCSAEPNRMYAGVGTDFVYVFHEEMTDQSQTDRGDEQGGWLTEIWVRVTVDSDGIIRGGQVELRRGYERQTCTYGRFENRLAEYDYCIQVIRQGNRADQTVVPDFEKYWRRHMDGYAVLEKLAEGPQGLFAEGNVVSGAEAIAAMLQEALENKGVYAPKYADLFAKGCADRFENLDWEQLGEGWQCHPAYDCYYMDLTEHTGCIRFCFYFYPDFDRMDVETAAAAALFCQVNDSGKLYAVDMQTVSMTTEEYVRIRGKREEAVRLVAKGTALQDGHTLRFPMLPQACESLPLWDYVPGRYSGISSVTGRKLPVWGYGEAAEAAAYLGGRLLLALNGRAVQSGELRELFADGRDAGEKLTVLEDCLTYAGEKWKPDKAYDCWEITGNPRAECMHFRYVFYRTKPFQGKLRNIWIDVFLTPQGIADIRPYVVISRSDITDDEKTGGLCGMT